MTRADKPAGTANTHIPCLLYSTPTATPIAPTVCAKDLTLVGMCDMASMVTQNEVMDPKKSAKLSKS